MELSAVERYTTRGEDSEANRVLKCAPCAFYWEVPAMSLDWFLELLHFVTVIALIVYRVLRWLLGW